MRSSRITDPALAAFMAQESEPEKKIKAKNKAKFETFKARINNMSVEEKEQRAAKLAQARVDRSPRTLEDKIAILRAKRKSQEETEALIDYPLESGLVRALILNCVQYMPCNMRIILSANAPPRAGSRAPRCKRIALIRKHTPPMFTFFPSGALEARLLRFRELKEAMNLILSQVDLIEVKSRDEYIKLYKPEKDKKEAGNVVTPGAATSEMSKGGHLISRVPLDSKGRRDGEEDRFVLFDGVPLLRRYWCQDVERSRKYYIKCVHEILDSVGILPVLHSIITNF